MTRLSTLLFTTPTGIAISIGMSVFLLLLTIGVAIGGSYWISIDNRNALVAQDNALHIREEQSQVRSSIPTCRALVKLDDAKNGASNASSDPHSYGHNLARAITGVVDSSKCRLLVFEVDHGVSIAKIVAEENAANGTPP